MLFKVSLFIFQNFSIIKRILIYALHLCLSRKEKKIREETTGTMFSHCSSHLRPSRVQCTGEKSKGMKVNRRRRWKREFDEEGWSVAILFSITLFCYVRQWEVKDSIPLCSVLSFRCSSTLLVSHHTLSQPSHNHDPHWFGKQGIEKRPPREQICRFRGEGRDLGRKGWIEKFGDLGFDRVRVNQ